MRSSYRQEDVVLLLKDITGLVEPQPAKERERRIQSGTHYCEMLPLEYVPTQQYMEVYQEALEAYAGPTAAAVGKLSDKIMERKGKEAVLVSLARAGIPAGILIKHYLKYKYAADMPHYAVSIIRGRGIDANAMHYLLDRYRPEQLLFVDGWIGKGAIYRELKKEIAAYPGVSDDIAVLADPANVTELCGTHEDILIPSSCLNSTVSGLISRTFLREDIIQKNDFHGAAYYGELKDSDLSYAFIEAIEQHFEKNIGINIEKNISEKAVQSCGLDEVQGIAAAFGIADINLIKPGIGETTRVLLRRVPWRILIDARYKEDRSLRPVVKLAEEKGAPIVQYSLTHYKCCGIIRKMADT